MKIVALSDLHEHLPKLPDADLVLIPGDFCCLGKPKEQLQWLRREFKPWLKEIKSPVFACAGNHDWPFFGQEYPSLKQEVMNLNLSWTYLEDSGSEFDGLKIWGTPWTLEFFNWAFNAKEAELAEKWKLIPDDTDIILTHGPPLGFGDYVIRNKTRVGSLSLLKRIEDVKPKLVVYGHIHCDHGHWDYDGVKLANVSVVDEKYRLVREPTEFTL